MSEIQPLTLSAPTPEYLVSIHGEGGNVIVGIKPDGTVEVKQPGSEPEAARRFYEALQFHGVSLHARAERAEAERDSLRLDAERLRAALLMMKHAFESDNRPNMLIVNAALSAAHGTEVKT